LGPKKEEKLEHTLLKSGEAKFLAKDSIDETSPSFGNHAAYIDSMNSLHQLLDRKVEKLPPPSTLPSRPARRKKRAQRLQIRRRECLLLDLAPELPPASSTPPRLSKRNRKLIND
jgi:hypothetical protein